MSFNLYLARHFAAPQPVEQIASIKPTTGSPYTYYPVIDLPIGAVKAGDVISVPAAYCQVSSRMAYNLMVASVLILTDQPMAYATVGSTGWGAYAEVSEANGTNIDNDVHHHVVRQSGQITAPADIEDAHLVLLVYAASTAYDGASLLTVNADYGRLEGAVHRKATADDLWNLLGQPAPAPAPEPDQEPAPPPAPAPEPAPAPAPAEQISIVLTEEQVAYVRNSD